MFSVNIRAKSSCDILKSVGISRGIGIFFSPVTGFTASKEALAFLLRQLTDIKNEVPDEDGIREIVDLWKNEDSGEIAPVWSEHLDWLIKRLISEQEA